MVSKNVEFYFPSSSKLLAARYVPTEYEGEFKYEEFNGSVQPLGSVPRNVL